MAGYFDEGKIDSISDGVVALADGYGQSGVLSGVSVDGYAWTLTKLRDGYGNSIGSLTTGGTTYLNVNALQTGTWTVTESNFPSTVNTNYGTVGASTIRTASQIGNATGAADFNFGTVGAQTLRIGAQIGNATGAADFNRGANTAQTLRVTGNANDGYGNAISSTIVSGKNGLDVNVIDSSASSALYAEDSASNSGDLGQFTLAVRNDADTALTSTDGDYSGIAVDAYGHIKMDLYDGYGYPQNKITSQASSSASASRRGLDVWDIKGTPQHFNGTVGTTASTITPTTTTISILIQNPSTNAAGVTLAVSFDAGTTFFDNIVRGGSLSIETEVTSFQIKASAASTTYRILVTRR